MDSEMLGRVISTARKQKNLSQKELGDLLNVSNKAVSKWENGEATPRSETLIKLCDILELNKTEILGFEQKYDSKEIDSLKSENSKLKNQIESINKKQKKALKYIFVVAICFVIFVVAVSFLISKNSSQNSNIDENSPSITNWTLAPASKNMQHISPKTAKRRKCLFIATHIPILLCSKPEVKIIITQMKKSII